MTGVFPGSTGCSRPPRDQLLSPFCSLLRAEVWPKSLPQPPVPGFQPVGWGPLLQGLPQSPDPYWAGVSAPLTLPGDPTLPTLTPLPLLAQGEHWGGHPTSSSASSCPLRASVLDTARVLRVSLCIFPSGAPSPPQHDRRHKTADFLFCNTSLHIWRNQGPAGDPIFLCS